LAQVTPVWLRPPKRATMPAKFFGKVLWPVLWQVVGKFFGNKWLA
jgi:hypothetical protein